MAPFRVIIALVIFFALSAGICAYGNTLAAILDSITPELLDEVAQSDTDTLGNCIKACSDKDINLPKEKPENSQRTPLVLIKEKPEVQKKENITLNIYKVFTQLGHVLTDKFDLKGQLKLLPLTKWRSVSVNPDEYEIIFAPFSFDELRSSFSVAFTIYSNEEELGSWTVPVSCELWQNVYFTTERVQRGISLASDNLRLKAVNVLRLPHKPFSGTVDLKLYETSRSISTDRPVLWNQVARKPDLRRGQIVEIVAEDGLMRISTKGVALENGLINDFVSVRNTQSRRDIQAQVINAKKVKVHF